MALPTKTQIETLADSLAASMALKTAAHLSGSVAPTTGSFRSLTDSLGDPDLEDLLNPTANALDVAQFDAASYQLNRLGPEYGPVLAALRGAVSTDGSYASFNAYVTGIGAKLPPELQAIAPAQQALGSNLPAAAVFSPAIAPAALDQVLAGADGALVDVTADAGDADTADVNLFASDSDALYLGWLNKPAGTSGYEYLTFQLSTNASADVAFNSQYWNGTAWVNLAMQYHNGTAWTDLAQAASEGTPTLGVKGFRQSGVIRFAVPAAWKRGNVAPGGGSIYSADLTPRFYIRMARTADTLVTAPVLTSLRAGVGLGLCLIKAANTVVFVPGSGVNTALYDAVDNVRFRALTNIGQNVTATPTYTNRAGTTGRSQAQSAWSTIAALDVFPGTPDTYLTLQSAGEGVQAVTAVAVTTTATSGVFALESVPLRTPVR